jgi:Bax protein
VSARRSTAIGLARAVALGTASAAALIVGLYLAAPGPRYLLLPGADQARLPYWTAIGEMVPITPAEVVADQRRASALREPSLAQHPAQRRADSLQANASIGDHSEPTIAALGRADGVGPSGIVVARNESSRPQSSSDPLAVVRSMAVAEVADGRSIDRGERTSLTSARADAMPVSTLASAADDPGQSPEAIAVADGLTLPSGSPDALVASVLDLWAAPPSDVDLVELLPAAIDRQAVTLAIETTDGADRVAGVDGLAPASPTIAAEAPVAIAVADAAQGGRPSPVGEAVLVTTPSDPLAWLVEEWVAADLGRHDVAADSPPARPLEEAVAEAIIAGPGGSRADAPPPSPPLRDRRDIVVRPALVADAVDPSAPAPFAPEDAALMLAAAPDWTAFDAGRRLLTDLPPAVRDAPSRAGVRAATPGTRLSSPTVRVALELLDQGLSPDARLVPAVFLDRVPSDITSGVVGEARKDLFVRFVLPHLVALNDRIANQRERLLDLLPALNAQATLAVDDQAFIDGLVEEYRLVRLDIDELVRRVDVVPPSMALGQAAEESGWGTSRAAREDNALFGQMTICPTGMCVQGFRDLEATVAAYLRNLNTHRAYRGFRDDRARARASGLPLDGPALLGRLERYSERGQDYIDAVRRLIAANRLTQFDATRLSDIEFLVAAIAR